MGFRNAGLGKKLGNLEDRLKKDRLTSPNLSSLISSDIPSRENDLGPTQEFGVYQVSPLPDRPENYGHGPDQSTRVKAHRFVPQTKQNSQLSSLMANEEDLEKLRKGLNTGTVYVRFVRGKRNASGTSEPVYYKYLNVPVGAYSNFRDNTSKGRDVTRTLDNFPYSRVTGEERTKYCSDM